MAFRMNGEHFGSNHNQKLASLRNVVPSMPARTEAQHDMMVALYASRVEQSQDIWTGEANPSCTAMVEACIDGPSYADDYNNHYNSGNVA